jgi:hypothetical protein
MYKTIIVVLLYCVFNLSVASSATNFDEALSDIYDELGLQEKLTWDVFKLSMQGFKALQEKDQLKKSTIITIIDYSKPSTEERLFVIDLENLKILYSSLVAHGKNSGWNFADNFSNVSGSLKSSLGFFLTADTYYGKHGYSLRLKGLENDFNDKAEDRAIVMHKARYVSYDFIKKHGRLGRSWGCPALPVKNAATIIDEIKSGSCLFIYAEDEDYLNKSKLINQISNTEKQ